MLNVKIAGVGCSLPAQRIFNPELERQLNLAPGWIERVTGIQERRYASAETTVGMGADAARQAIADAKLNVADIECIISASAAPQQAVPCTAAFLQRELGLAEIGCPCFDVDATCLSFLFALHTAAHFVAGGAYKHILIVSSEISTFSRNPYEPESKVLFGDAAAAAVIMPAGENEPSCIWHSAFATDSRGAELTQVVGGGSLHHPNDPATKPEQNLFSMCGPQVFRMSARALPPFFDTFFAHLPFGRSDIHAVVPHQASSYGLRLLWGRLGFDREQVVVNLPMRGNCVAASIPLALAEAVQSGRIQRGQRILLAGTGAGLSMGAMALTY